MMLDRREFLQAVLAGAVGSTFTYRALAQTAPPAITATKLAPDLVVLSGDGGNVAIVIGPDSLLMIDGGLPDRSADLLKAVSEVDSHKVATLFNTHWHFDHVGSNEALGKMGAKIIAHENVKKRLGARVTIEALNRTFDPLKPEGMPAETFTTGGNLTFGKQRLEYTHFPAAHTDGDACVFFPALNVLHTGDLLFNRSYPLIDYSTGGYIEGMVRAAEALGKIGDAQTRIIPGHGPMATKSDLQAARDMLATTYERLAPMIKAGKSVEEAIAARPTREFDERFSLARKPDAFVQIAYTSILRHEGRQ
jgi:cyclase